MASYGKTNLQTLLSNASFPHWKQLLCHLTDSNSSWPSLCVLIEQVQAFSFQQEHLVNHCLKLSLLLEREGLICFSQASCHVQLNLSPKISDRTRKLRYLCSSLRSLSYLKRQDHGVTCSFEQQTQPTMRLLLLLLLLIRTMRRDELAAHILPISGQSGPSRLDLQDDARESEAFLNTHTRQNRFVL